MFTRLTISLKCWPLRILARSAVHHLPPKIYWVPDSGFSRCIKSPKTLHRVHLTNLQSRFLPAPGNSSIWQSEYLTSSTLTRQRLQGFARSPRISYECAYSQWKIDGLTNESKKSTQQQKNTWLFGNFSQHGGGRSSQFPKPKTKKKVPPNHP